VSIHAVDGEVRDVKGHVLPHEHIFCDFTPVTGDSDHLLNDKTLAIREIQYFEQAGGSVIVDVTPIDLGRMPDHLLSISRELSVRIVMGTGWYREAFYPPHINTSTTKDLAENMIKELTAGVELESGEHVFAGVIGEIGVDTNFVSALEERVLRASAIASVETGAPVTTHASMWPIGSKQIDLLIEGGVSAEKIIIGHADTYLDIDYHRAILDAGCYLQFDTIGRNHMNADEDRVSALVGLIDLGYTDRILLSTDRCFRSDIKTFGGKGYDYLVTEFRSTLSRNGISDESFRTLTQTNPLSALSW